MKKLFLFLTVACALLTSCGDDDEDASATMITISANATTGVPGDTFTFTVMDDLGNTVTSSSTIYVNGTAISGSTYTADASGTDEVYAMYENLTSASISIEVAAVAEENSIFYDAANYSVNNSALVFWGGYDDNGTTKAYWSLLAFTGTTIDDANVEVSDNYLDVEFLTALDSEGSLVPPTPSTAEYLDVYQMYVDGTAVVDLENDVTVTETNADFALGTTFEDLTETSVEYSLDVDLDGVATTFMYDGALLGVYDASGSRINMNEDVRGVISGTLSTKAELEAKKAAFFAQLAK
ncbi:hypothetical protein SAMN05216480_10712 [Pustulibacterium marinum]|uniref:Ig-like domain (Group 3) n=1 Tax=Pustulibacterium marinum TaxID=1224947 RepID=A0A1I7H3J7_9FLAO|nr:hypothetical protein [Pustulibacterium marinum]SFU55250.1 hypothetical protein SAMN05216480_10712 [Pustulibacterium marinum]